MTLISPDAVWSPSTTRIGVSTTMTPARVLDAVLSGARVDVDDAETLLHGEGAEFERLLEVAASLRDDGLALAGRRGVITYSRKAFLPLTTLCRDRCHYCVFVNTPAQLEKLHKPMYMSAEQVLTVARRAQALGCKEVLLTLGDRPEDRWPAARAWLDEHSYASTLDYVAAMARLVTAETGMLAHANPGVMSRGDLDVMRSVAPSMGMMLETTSRGLFDQAGQVHYGSPDKDPDVRLRVIEDAGAAGIPFTTGILVGIGETVRDRAESLIAIRAAHERHGHVQEVIVQNFRAKPRTVMRDAPDTELREYLATVAVARVVMGSRMRIQVPPNLSDATELEFLVRAGIDDWGGVSPLTADHVNPERPWPQINTLAAHTAAAGYRLAERLTVHPEYVRNAATWIDPALHGPVAALADPVTGLATSQVFRRAQPDEGPRAPIPAPAQIPVRAQRDEVSVTAVTTDLATGPLPGRSGSLRALIQAAESSSLSLDDGDWERLLRATGSDLDALAQAADDVRRYTVGEAVSIVVNRNLTTSGFREVREDDPATFTLDDVAAIASDAQELGATELCIQGRVPDVADWGVYLDIVRVAKAAAPGVHVHAYSPQDVGDFAQRSGLSLDDALRALRDAGVDTVPGTGVKVLAERVRTLVAPSDLEIECWVDGITAAHRAGFRSTSVLFYGHVETAAERIAHMRRLREIQDRTGGFAEFVPIPLPGAAGGVPLCERRSPLDEHRAMVAVSRLLLNGSIRHIQVPWTRVGRDAAKTLLQSGADDLGGTLLDGRVRPGAGVEHGRELPLSDAAALAAHLFRSFRQRATDYTGVARAAGTGVCV